MSVKCSNCGASIPENKVPLDAIPPICPDFDGCNIRRGMLSENEISELELQYPKKPFKFIWSDNKS